MIAIQAGSRLRFLIQMTDLIAKYHRRTSRGGGFGLNRLVY